MANPAPPAPRAVDVARALVTWTSIFLAFSIGTLLDLLLRGDSIERRAERLRKLVDRAGGPYRKIGIQFAMRIDLFPIEVCAALNDLVDRMPPFELKAALALVEAAVRRPIEQAFQVFDPEPIVSNSVACIYQAVLDDGSKVAVKVRRPDMNRKLASCVSGLSMLIGLLELLTFVRPGRFRHLRAEMISMVLEEFDFVLIARYQRMLGKHLRKAKIRYATTAAIRREYTTEDVIVSEFVSGVWLDEVISPEPSRAAATAAQLREKGIDATLVGKRILHLGWWGLLENVFFTAHPRPENIVVREGSQIVFIQVSECAILPRQRRRMLAQTLRMLAASDGSEASSALIHLLSPLPFIDAGELQRHLESRVWPRLFAMQNEHNPWWERTTTGLWVSLMETGRAYNLSYRLEVIRLMRACMSFDILAGSVWPGLKLLPEFKRYQKAAERRRARAGRKRVRKLLPRKDGTPQNYIDIREAMETWRRLNLWGQTVLEGVPIEFYSLAKKGSYSLSVAMRAVIGIVAGAVIPALIASAMRGEIFRVPLSWASLAPVVTHPVYVVFFFGASLHAIRTIRYRLNDLDVTGR